MGIFNMLRFMTCGAVDNGKSTLLGRILSDSNVVMKDQAVGDLAHIFDGLQEEREKGITIDVAYGFFRTKKRTFRIADAPGHAEFLSNMVTAATNVDVAILLIDAKQGISAQTLKHSEVLDFVGVSKVIVAINKMDVVKFSQKRFDQIQSDFANLPYQFEKIYIPIAARHGDNVVYKSRSMPWYEGKTLLEILETITIPQNKNHSKAWTVQHKDDHTYCGLPHLFKVGEKVFTSKGQHVIQNIDEQCLELTIDLTRGDYVSPCPIKLLKHFYVTLLGFEPIEKDKKYIIQFQHVQRMGLLKDDALQNQFVKTQLVLDDGACADSYALIIHPETYKTIGLLKIEPSIFWFTGRSGAGKTTLALETIKHLDQVILLDGDQIRSTVNTDLGLSEDDRKENVRRISEIAYVLLDQGYRVFVTCIAPYREQREQLKCSLPMAEIFVDASLEECAKRDPKGLYAKGIGSNSPYEEPLKPDLQLKTADMTIEECVKKILEHFQLGAL